MQKCFKVEKLKITLLLIINKYHIKYYLYFDQNQKLNRKQAKLKHGVV